MRIDSKKNKSDSLIVFRDNKLNFASYQGFTLNQYQVFLILISKLKAYHSYNKPLTNLHVTLEAAEFKKEFQIIGNVSYSILQTSVDHLLKTQLLVPEDNSQNFTKINICSKARYMKTAGRIEVKFTDDIFPYLTKAKKQFTSYRLKDVSHFGSMYTTRLYELIMQHKNTGWFLATIETLRRVFSASKKFTRYFDFKKKTFEHACKEINKIHNINLQFTEIKEGKKVVKIRFNFTPQSKQSSQEAPIEQITHSQEIPVSDDKLVQTSFVEISPITEQKSPEQIEKTSNSTSLPPIPPKEEKQTPSHTKSLWQKIRSFLF